MIPALFLLAAITFRDAGTLPVRLNHAPSAQKLLPETMAGGIASFDYNGDGLLDLLLTGASDKQDRLFENKGNFRFADVTQAAGLSTRIHSIAAAVADYNKDGHPDLLIAGVNGLVLYSNNGKRFTDVTAAAGLTDTGWSVAAGWFDADNDGHLDLFLVHYVVWPPATDRACLDPGGSRRVYCHPKYFAPTANRLFRNKGNGTFEDISKSSGIAASRGKGMSVTFADFDNDGRLDIFVPNDALPNFFFHNLGANKFEEVSLTAGVSLPDSGRAVSGMGADFRDVNNDGRPDLIFTALAGESFPYFQNTGQGFEDRTARSRLAAAVGRKSGWGIAIADLDNDGHKDILTANSHVMDNIDQHSGDKYRLPLSLFRNQGDATFAEVPNLFPGAAAHRGLVVADLDNDGRLDVVATRLGEEPRLWRNESPVQNWITVDVPIGTKIKIGAQHNHQTTAVGYASSLQAPVHFGLGSVSKIPAIQITYPNGQTKTLTNVPANQRLKP
jgi:hypothetical protein